MENEEPRSATSIWLKRLLADMLYTENRNKPIVIFEDDQAAIKFATNPECAKGWKAVETDLYVDIYGSEAFYCIVGPNDLFHHNYNRSHNNVFC